MQESLARFCNRIQLLEKGMALVLKHSIYGIFKIKMNPQGNRIYIDEVIEATETWETEIKKSPNCLADEDKILSLLFWNGGEWYYIKEKPYETKPISLWDRLKDKYTLKEV